MVFKAFRKGFMVFYLIQISLFNELLFNCIKNHVCPLHLLFDTLFTFLDKSTQRFKAPR